MKKIDLFLPVVNEALAGAAGGASLGSISGVFAITILGAIVGALLVGSSSARLIRQSQRKEPTKKDLEV